MHHSFPDGTGVAFLNEIHVLAFDIKIKHRVRTGRKWDPLFSMRYPGILGQDHYEWGAIEAAVRFEADRRKDKEVLPC